MHFFSKKQFVKVQTNLNVKTFSNVAGKEVQLYGHRGCIYNYLTYANVKSQYEIHKFK